MADIQTEVKNEVKAEVKTEMREIRRILNFFDKFEDRVRGRLSKYPILYTFIGGVAIVLFWRGVWHTADLLKEQGGWVGWLFYEPVNLAIVVLILLATGLFVSYFIGDTILMSGLKHEKKTTDKTEKEVAQEEARLTEMRHTIGEMKKEMDEIRNIVVEEHKQHHGNK